MQENDSNNLKWLNINSWNRNLIICKMLRREMQGKCRIMISTRGFGAQIFRNLKEHVNDWMIPH